MALAAVTNLPGPTAQHCILQLLSVLGAPPLSVSVTSELHYEEMSDWHEMAQRIADALLLAQRWCWYNKTYQEYIVIAGGSDGCGVALNSKYLNCSMFANALHDCCILHQLAYASKGLSRHMAW